MNSLKICLLMVTLLMSLALSTGAEHAWREIDSPHFTVICNASEKDGRDAAADLERIRTTVARVLPGVRQEPNVPIIAFVTAEEDTFATLVPIYRERPQGSKPNSIFQPGRDWNFIVMRVAFRVSSEYHLKFDYAGMVAGLSFPRAPLWLRSGFAQFFAISEITDDYAKVGQAAPRYIARLAGGSLTPPKRLVTVGTNSPEYKDPEKRWEFDAESWGLFHYLMLGDEGAHRKQLQNYLQLLSQGKRYLEAAEGAFGDLGKLQDKLEAYYHRRTLPFAHVDVPHQDSSSRLETHALSTAASNAWLAEYYLRFRRKTEAKPLIDSALAESSAPGIAHEAMGIYDLGEADYENALKEFSAATAADSSLYLAYYYKGVLSSYGKSPSEIPENSVRDLRRATEIAPRYAPALLQLARLLVRTAGNVNDALVYARRAVEAAATIDRYHLAYANILLKASAGEEAEAEARQTLSDELSPVEESSATEILRFAQECKPGNPCKALDWHEFESSSPASSLPPASGAASPGAGQDSTVQLKVRGIIRVLTCSPDGKALTLTSNGKDMTFNVTKTTRIMSPETFWMSTAYLDICKHLAGEPAQVTYKPGPSDAPAQEATSIEIQDRY
jgi:hypothetical protein